MGVGFVRPHTPLYAPQRFFDMFPIDEVELEPIKDGDVEDTYYTANLPLDRKGPRYYRTIKESYPDVETGLKADGQRLIDEHGWVIADGGEVK